ncbi:hypothetical protein V2J09_011625 [Rumex salicifolius]
MSKNAQAFEEAWAAACNVDSSTLVVPSAFEFLVKPVSFSGTNCAPNITVQLDGMISAPKNRSNYEEGLLKWLNFSKLKSFTIKGNGSIDGQGHIWWNNESALRFYRSSDVTVTGITIKNSQQCHLKFDDCTNVQVYNFSTSSPYDSPNTDGIHLQNSQNVLIRNVSLSCGDDCISIQTGSSNIYIHDMNCGPGHGISIGGLGKDNTTAWVSNVTVKDVALRETTNGVRIKTWQYYCDKKRCRNVTNAVAITGVTYDNIRGTYTKEPVHLACSDRQPCKGISLSNIELRPVVKDKLKEPFCWNVYGEAKTNNVPSIDCLKDEGNSSYLIQ